MKTNNMVPSRQLNSGAAMTNQVTQQLQAGWLDKVESDRIAEVRKRANKFASGYVSSKAVFHDFKVEYQTDGIARLYSDHYDLSGMTDLRAFKQTGWTYYEHYSGKMGIYLRSVPHEKSYLKINLPALMAGSVA
ncbi:hypothetical protein IBT49_04605 [Erwinia sp. S63]|uniref:hypothetical protein n=1 Tax=Erwinia sp. S63 TaxID=2769341 RepID=UPI00190BADBA|nr:hypothetical protein [Erwinia sp. S63]MBK0095245.1 hypothetical protein [Erwinia sp. S63]